MRAGTSPLPFQVQWGQSHVMGWLQLMEKLSLIVRDLPKKALLQQLCCSQVRREDPREGWGVWTCQAGLFLLRSCSSLVFILLGHCSHIPVTALTPEKGLWPPPPDQVTSLEHHPAGLKRIFYRSYSVVYSKQRKIEHVISPEILYTRCFN